MSQTVLVVDDEKHIVQLVKLYLGNEGYQVEVAHDGQDALEKARLVKPDLIVLDLMLPKVSGLEVCRQLRQESDVPIIMLTARDESEDRVAGLELGADDYVTKPFNPRELAARVKAVLRRTTGMGAGQRPLEVGNVRVDPDRHEVTIGDRRVELRPKEFELLTVLARRPGVVLPRERLRQLVWGPDFYGDPRTVDVHITWLRDKLSGATARIQTVWGVGYKLVESDGTDDPLEGGRRARRERASAENPRPHTVAWSRTGYVEDPARAANRLLRLRGVHLVVPRRVGLPLARPALPGAAGDGAPGRHRAAAVGLRPPPRAGRRAAQRAGGIPGRPGATAPGAPVAGAQCGSPGGCGHGVRAAGLRATAGRRKHARPRRSAQHRPLPDHRRPVR